MKLKVAFLDCTSHGDCAVITFDEVGRRACIVVDGGELKASATSLAAYLESEDVGVIDLMIGTHIDSDHINGLKYFVQNQVALRKKKKPYVGIKEFWGPKPSEEYLPNVVGAGVPETGEVGTEDLSWRDFVIQSVTQNDDLYHALGEFEVPIRHPAMDDLPEQPFKDVALELVGPDTQIPADHISRKALATPGVPVTERKIKTLEDLRAALTDNATAMATKAKRNANNQSIVFRLRPRRGRAAGRAWTFLFTGDAEEEAWKTMLSHAGRAKYLKSRVLKIPHHGSAINGLTPKGASKVKPRYSVNLVGQKHGLPDEGTFKLVKDHDSEILCTQKNASESHQSACHGVPGADCPAKDDPRTVSFIIDTVADTVAKTCKITPSDRACRHDW